MSDTPLVNEPSYNSLTDKDLKSLLDKVLVKDKLQQVVFWHRWEENDGEKEWYKASIIGMDTTRKFGIQTYRVSYLQRGFENPDMASEHRLFGEELACDIMTGDVRITNPELLINSVSSSPSS